MVGTLINTAGILAGTALGLSRLKPLTAAHQFFLKAALGAFTVFCGLRLTLISFQPAFLPALKQLAIVLLAMTLGKIAGRALRLQKGSNRLGRFAREKISASSTDIRNRFTNGFAVCSILFCAAPLGMLGALTDGLSGYISPLVIKAVMDGVAAMSFAAMFGWGILFSAIPVLVFQGSITLLANRFLLPLLEGHDLLDPLNATAGLLIFTVSLIIFEVKKIEVTDYLPSLAFAPLLAWWWR